MIIKAMVNLQQLNSGYAFETVVNSHEINENRFTLGTIHKVRTLK